MNIQRVIMDVRPPCKCRKCGLVVAGMSVQLEFIDLPDITQVQREVDKVPAARYMPFHWASYGDGLDCPTCK